MTQTVVGLSLRRSGFDWSSFQVVFLVERGHGGRILSVYFGFPPFSIIPPILQTHLLPTLFPY